MATVIVGDFEWDEAKSRANAAKHGVTFNEAIRAFLDPLAIDHPDRVHPDRWILLAMSVPARLLYVVYTERTASGRTRLISRRASRHEKKDYEER